MAQLDIEAVKNALSCSFVLQESCVDTIDGYTGLKYFSHCLQRWSYTEPTFNYIWFGELTSDVVHQEKWYENYETGASEKEVISAPMIISHCEISQHIKTGKWCICHIAVHSEYQQQGFSKKLIDDVVAFCIANNIKHIERTKPSKEGKNFLYDNVTNALNKAGITFSEYGA